MNEEKNMTESTQKTTSMGVILGVLVVCALVAGGIYWFTTGDRGMSTDEVANPFGSQETGTGSETPTLGELPDVVAEVNGVAIPKEDLEQIISQAEATYAQQGADLTDPAVASEIRTQALESAINVELLDQAAVASGVSLDDGVVEEEIAAVRARFADEAAFLAELEAADFTLEEFTQNITEQLIVNKYVESSEAFTSIQEVTEEEARAFYDEFAAQATGEVPSFEDVRPQIEVQLTQQKQQEAVAGLLDELRAAATIDVKI